MVYVVVLVDSFFVWGVRFVVVVDDGGYVFVGKVCFGIRWGGVVGVKFIDICFVVRVVIGGFFIGV